MKQFIFAACSLLLLLQPSVAEELSFKQIVDGIREQSDEIRNASPITSLESLLPKESAQQEAQEEAKGLLEELQRTNKDMRMLAEAQESKSTYTNHSWLIFASLGMGEDSFNAVLQAASLQRDSIVLLRGIPKDAKLAEAVLEVQKRASKFDPVPNVVINPDLFKKHNIQSVPVVVKLTPREGAIGLPREVARVSGLSDTVWLERKLEEGRTGDLGARGPLAEITEQDFIEAAKERVAAIDWEAKKEQAVENFWQKRTFNELPQAIKSRTRFIDPSFVVTADVRAPNGQLIVHRGQSINPLKVRSFPQAVLVFDPLSKKQLELVKELSLKLQNDARFSRVNLIATRIDKEDGWGSYEEITEYLQEHVYLLTPDIKRTFELEFTPSLVTAADLHFQVEEFGEDEL
ncbi:TrbC family F-type conjugative pilus assembly protein [Pseudovibrio sp. Ad37]|uniref:TrbC family F-type conjugative pilus assembly protein n=1 Tax=Pseudovibrio sp. Ad37 TaxID=989422 RepID=UPI0007AE3E19|nr:TrbC family F-type conjugative pilus assembly protein [Pseudovibrio sp. Ad37]KZL22682.1 Type-F conjugative transfer system pilin assembly protein [Pseudovibrio sp. Ad37]